MIVLKDAPDITIEMPKELLSGTICLHIYGLQAKDIDLQNCIHNHWVMPATRDFKQYVVSILSCNPD
jgi:hypothetical protein